MKRVVPFSNLTEFLFWKADNCDKCLRYENRSTEVNNAKCRLAFYLDLGTVSDGTISLLTAKKIGIKGEVSGEFCTLKDKCSYFDKPIKRYPKRKDKRQLELF